MQNNTRTGGAENADPIFRSNPQAMNWNTEAAASVGTLDTKDLSIIQDEMHSEALLGKKCSIYSEYFTDPQLKSMASNAAEHHRRHFDSLQSYLNASN